MKKSQQRLAWASLLSAACLLGLRVDSLRAQQTTGTTGDSVSLQQTDSRGKSVQNPPGYRAMERPADVPADSAARDSNSASRDSTKWGYRVDTTGKAQNPAGYRGMERPENVLPKSGAKVDSSAPADATSRIHQKLRQESSSAPGQNPPGYRGMERPQGLDRSKDSASAATPDSSATTGDSTSNK
jgi:hypothetical protein